MIAIPSLPYSKDSLEPYISTKTIDFHYGKHHQAYVNNLNALMSKTPFEGLPLEQIIIKSDKEKATDIFNNAAQVFNHNFYWTSMKKNGGGKPSEQLLKQLVKDFGSYENFEKEFKTAGLKLFGSGWVWLVSDGKKLQVIKTSNAETPITKNLKPILTMDVWEHAYYLDYQNERKKYIDSFFDHLINWEFAEKNFIEI